MSTLVDYENKCPKCGAGTFLSEDGIQVCANIGGWEDDEGEMIYGCGWRSDVIEEKD